MSDYRPLYNLKIALDGSTPRACGDCGLCCKLLPVTSIQKPRNHWCTHYRLGKGCTVYDRRPTDCRVWSCKWVLDVNMSEDMMPERSHVVFDCVMDVVTINGTTKRHVAQLWVDPRFPDAWKEPAVKAEIERIGIEDGVATIVRIVTKGILVVPPGLSSTGEWHYQESELTPDPKQEWERPHLPPGAMPR